MNIEETKIKELSRETEIKKFIKIMNEKHKFNNEMLSYNMVINGRWGDGKTTFLNQIKEYIKNNADTGIDLNKIITISAWDYDYLDNPAEMILSIFNKNENEVIKKIWGVLISFLSSLSDEMIQQNSFLRIINSTWKKTKDKAKWSQEKSGISNILSFNDLKKALQDGINIDYGDVYIFIDDLDRCNPNFTIKLFEVLKHLFNIKNVVIIYMLDFKNVNESIMNYYHLPIPKNDNVNENYLSKIIDYVHDLDEVDKTTYLLNKYGLSEFEDLKKLNIFSDDFSNYILEVTDYQNILKILKEKSFREQEKIILKIAEIYNIEKKENINVISSNTKSLKFYFIALFFIEYLCNKNISNSKDILQKIKKTIYESDWFELIEEIIIFSQKIYKNLGFDEDFKIIGIDQLLNSIKRVNFLIQLGNLKNYNNNQDWNYIKNNFEKYFLNLIKFCF